MELARLSSYFFSGTPCGLLADCRRRKLARSRALLGVAETPPCTADDHRIRSDPLDNPLKRAPHTLAALTADDWSRSYSRQQAAFPAGPQQQAQKVWPAVARIDNAYGDRNLVCTCGPIEEYAMSLDADTVTV